MRRLHGQKKQVERRRRLVKLLSLRVKEEQAGRRTSRAKKDLEPPRGKPRTKKVRLNEKPPYHVRERGGVGKKKPLEPVTES